MPLLNTHTVHNHIAYPCATKILNDFVGSKDKELYEVKGGRIGVFVRSKSQKELAPSVAQWLNERSDRCVIRQNKSKK